MGASTYVLRLKEIEVDEERLEGQPDDIEDLVAIGVSYVDRPTAH